MSEEYTQILNKGLPFLQKYLEVLDPLIKNLVNEKFFDSLHQGVLDCRDKLGIWQIESRFPSNRYPQPLQ